MNNLSIRIVGKFQSIIHKLFTFFLGGQVTIDPSLSEIRAGTSCLASSCIMTVGLLIISTIFR